MSSTSSSLSSRVEQTRKLTLSSEQSDSSAATRRDVLPPVDPLSLA